MPNISTITVSGTNYDVADSVARNIVNNTADYVVDKNSYVVGNTTWFYRKWNSGTAECWCQYTFSATANNAWGSLFDSEAISLPAFPFTFAEIPQVFLSSGKCDYSMLIERGSQYGWATESSPGLMWVIRPVSTNNGIYRVNIYAIGKV